MKVKGQNGVIVDIPETVATGMVSAGIVEAVPDEDPSAEGTLIASLTMPEPPALVDTGADTEPVADATAPAEEEKPKHGGKSDK